MNGTSTRLKRPFLGRSGGSFLQAQDSSGRTPLYRAVEKNDFPTIKRLLAQGSNPNQADKNGQTPLHLAASQGHLDTVRALVQRGAFVDAKNASNLSPKKVTLRSHHLPVAILLAGISQKRKQSLVPSHHWKTKELLHGDLLRHTEQWEEAERVYQDLFTWAKVQKDIPLQISTLKKIGDVSLTKNNPIKAAHYYNCALALCANKIYPHLLERLAQTERMYAEDILKTTSFSTSATTIAQKRTTLTQMRKEAIDALERGTPISEILKDVTTVTKGITQELLHECFQALGAPPCTYAIAGLGSISKEEMVFCSDLQIAIFVQENTLIVREYFGKLLCLLELKTINLGEAYSSLESEKRLGTPRDIADIFGTMCLLHGSDSLVKQYEKREINKMGVLASLKKDLIAFAPQLKEKKPADESLHLNKLYHFVSETIEKLSLHHGIATKNTERQIEKLKNKKTFSNEGYENLRKTLDHIQHLRLRASLDQEDLSKIYQVLSPLHQALLAFCERDKNPLRQSTLCNTTDHRSQKFNHQSSQPITTRNAHLASTPKKQALKEGQLKVAQSLSQKKAREKIKFLPLTHPQRKALWLGDLAGEQNLIDDALPHYQKALEEGTKKHDLPLQITCLKKMGNSWLVRKDYARAAYYYNTALALLEKVLKSAPPHPLFQSQREKLWKHLELVETNCTSRINPFPLSIEKKRTRLLQMRKRAQESLQQQIPSNVILAKITKEAKSLTQILLSECLESLDPPPCNYAILALGSMSRYEMSLYSDVELAVLLEKNTEDTRAYFRKFIQLFQIKMINLGETRAGILPEGESATIEGFHLDSINPLQIEELLSTPEEMAAVQGQSDPILPNLLRASDLLEGDASLLTTYQEALSAHWHNKTSRHIKALSLLEKDLKTFEPQLTQSSTQEETDEPIFALNIKGALYRLPSEVINKLCLYYGIWEKNTWDRLKKLKEKHIISEQGHKNLCEAMDAITRFRLRCHSYYGMENEDVYHRGKKPAEKLFELNEGDMQTLIAIYKVLLPLHETLQLFCAHKGETTCLRENPFCDQGRTAEGTAYERMEKYDEAEKCYREAIGINPEDMKARLGLGNIFYYTRKYDEAIAYYEQILSSLKQSEKQEELKIAEILDRLGHIFCALNQHKKAIDSYYEPALVIRKKHLGAQDTAVAESLHHLAAASRALEDKEKAISLYKDALSIYARSSRECTTSLAKTLRYLGDTWYASGEKTKAAEFYTQALYSLNNAFGENHPDSASLLMKLGYTWSKLAKYEEAKNSYEKALKIYRSLYAKTPSEKVKRQYKKAKKLYKEMQRTHHVLLKNKWLENALTILQQNDPAKKTLNLRRANVTNEILLILAHALAANQSIQNLNLGNNDIGRKTERDAMDIITTSFPLKNSTRIHTCSQGILAFSKVLTNHVTLLVLNLQMNNLGMPEIQAIAKALKKNQHLLKLDLRANQLGDAEAKVLANTLQCNKTLHWLNLSLNNIGDEGAIALAKALEKNLSLRSLYLHDNQVSDTGAKALATMLRINTHLKNLGIENNPMSKKSFLILQQSRLTNICKMPE